MIFFFTLSSAEFVEHGTDFYCVSFDFSEIKETVNRILVKARIRVEKSQRL